MDDPNPDRPKRTGIRPATRVIGRLAMTAVFLGAECVSLVILALIALHVDEWSSADQPVQEMIATVERLRGTATILWRYRRSRFLGVFMPIEAVLCGAPEPC